LILRKSWTRNAAEDASKILEAETQKMRGIKNAQEKINTENYIEA